MAQVNWGVLHPLTSLPLRMGMTRVFFLFTILLAIGISLISTWVGLALAFIGHWPVSFYIVALTSFFYILARCIRHFRTPRGYLERPHPNREIVPPIE